MLSIGIIGLPNVGKSTLFKALTNVSVDIQNYPFTTIDPNVGVVAVPDERLEKLAKIYNSQKVTPAAIEFIDIAGLVKGAHQGEGLGNKFLSHIREGDATVQVVRAFEDTNITHVHDSIDPAHDIEVVNTELVMADLETVDKRIEKAKKESRSDKSPPASLNTLDKLKRQLEKGLLISQLELPDKESGLVKELNLLTSKKFIYVINVSEDQLKSGWEPSADLKSAFSDSPFVIMDNKIELELSKTKDKKGSLNTLIKESYQTLGLITFFTTNESEARAWTLRRRATAIRAAGVIHTDFEKKFIRAEITNWEKLIGVGGWNHARAKGLVNTVGKDYIIQEGDVMHVKI